MSIYRYSVTIDDVQHIQKKLLVRLALRVYSNIWRLYLMKDQSQCAMTTSISQNRVRLNETKFSPVQVLQCLVQNLFS